MIRLRQPPLLTLPWKLLIGRVSTYFCLRRSSSPSQLGCCSRPTRRPSSEYGNRRGLYYLIAIFLGIWNARPPVSSIRALVLLMVPPTFSFQPVHSVTAWRCGAGAFLGPDPWERVSMHVVDPLPRRQQHAAPSDWVFYLESLRRVRAVHYRWVGFVWSHTLRAIFRHIRGRDCIGPTTPSVWDTTYIISLNRLFIFMNEDLIFYLIKANPVGLVPTAGPETT